MAFCDTIPYIWKNFHDLHSSPCILNFIFEFCTNNKLNYPLHLDHRWGLHLACPGSISGRISFLSRDFSRAFPQLWDKCHKNLSPIHPRISLAITNIKIIHYGRQWLLMSRLPKTSYRLSVLVKVQFSYEFLFIFCILKPQTINY